MKPAAIRAWLPPSSSIRSGTRTSIAPNISEGTVTKASAVRTGRLTIVATTSRRPCVSGTRVSGTREATRAKTTAIAITEPKTTSVPTEAAIAPSAGPTRAPATAVPSAVPITEPRCSGGAVVTSQVSAPDQISAPAIPWTKRAPSSRAICLPKPKTRLAAPSSSRPAMTLRRGPKRAATSPAGSEASSVPAA